MQGNKKIHEHNLINNNKHVNCKYGDNADVLHSMKKIQRITRSKGLLQRKVGNGRKDKTFCCIRCFFYCTV
jgi:hypothetical protein